MFLSLSFFVGHAFSSPNESQKNVRVRGNKSAGETRGSVDRMKLNIDIALSWTRILKQDVWKFKTWLEQFVDQAANNNEGFMLTVLVHCSWQSHWELTRYFDKVYTTPATRREKHLFSLLAFIEPFIFPWYNQRFDHVPVRHQNSMFQVSVNSIFFFFSSVRTTNIIDQSSNYTVASCWNFLINETLLRSCLSILSRCDFRA